MAYPRPKILTAVTVPTGGWDLVFSVSVAAQYDTQLTATVPAGTYFVAWDGQSDDLLYALMVQMNVQLTGNKYAVVEIGTNNKVKIHFRGSDFVDAAGYENDVKLEWTASNSDLAAALGFDATADDESTSTDRPEFEADYQHAWGWYADADGQLVSLLVEDVAMTETPQAIAYSGHSYAQQIGERYTNELELDWLSRARMFSRGKAYGDAPVHPYSYNVGLEHWWHSVKTGTRFRVYREGRNAVTAPIETFENDLASTTQLRDSNKSWETAPQEHASRLAVVPRRFDAEPIVQGRWFITSHTATTITIPNADPGGLTLENGSYNTAYILDQRYQTYVVDFEQMQSFAPRERANVDYYGITIPLIRYEA